MKVRCYHLFQKGFYDSLLVKKPLHKKWSFLLRIFSVNVTKSAGNCRFGHIYWRNSFFCAVNRTVLKLILRVVLMVIFTSNRTELFCKNGVLTYFAELKGKHLCKSLFLKKVAGITPHISKNSFRQLLVNIRSIRRS